MKKTKISTNDRRTNTQRKRFEEQQSHLLSKKSSEVNSPTFMDLIPVSFLFFLGKTTFMPGIGLGALCMLNKCYTTELHSQPLNFETGSHCIIQAGFKHKVLLPLPPEDWGYRQVPPHLAEEDFTE
jgi:hypothetical protein